MVPQDCVSELSERPISLVLISFGVELIFFQGHAPVVVKFFPGGSFSARSTITVQFFSDCGSFPGSSPTASVSKYIGSIERDGDRFRIHLARPIGDTGPSTHLICLPLFPLVMNRLGRDKMIGSTGEASVRSSTPVALLLEVPHRQARVGFGM